MYLLIKYLWIVPFIIFVSLGVMRIWLICNTGLETSDLLHLSIVMCLIVVILIVIIKGKTQ